MKHLLIILIILLISQVEFNAQDLFPYREGKKWGYMNTKGEIVVKPKYDEASCFFYNSPGDQDAHKITRIRKGKKYGYINDKGKELTKIKFIEAEHFNASGYDVAVKDKKESYRLNSVGLRTERFMNLDLGTGAIVCHWKRYRVGDKFRLIKYNWHEEQKDTLTSLWDDTYENHDGYIAVKLDDQWGVLNKKGNLITKIEYDSISVNSGYWFYGNHFFKVLKNGRYGFLNAKGKVIAAPQYTQADDFNHGCAKVWINDEFWGYIDEEGREYFKRKKAKKY